MVGLSGISLSKEEQVLVGRIEDMLLSGHVHFTHFLTEREQVIASRVTVRHDTAAYYGGYSGAERVMLGMFPVNIPIDLSAFPIFPITISWHKTTLLSHRDILGSLMSLLITRDSIGDILVGDQKAYVFLNKIAADVACNGLSKMGNVGIRLEAGADISSLPEQQYLILQDTVSSMRLDAVVAAFMNKSRSASGDLIASGLVQQNALLTTNLSQPVLSGDKISVRGYGKAQIIDKGPSKKGRIRIEIRKYL